MAMTIIVEPTRDVTGGVDTHLDVHVAAVLDEIGGLLATESSRPTRAVNTDLFAGWDRSGRWHAWVSRASSHTPGERSRIPGADLTFSMPEPWSRMLAICWIDVGFSEMGCLGGLRNLTSFQLDDGGAGGARTHDPRIMSPLL